MTLPPRPVPTLWSRRSIVLGCASAAIVVARGASADDAWLRRIAAARAGLKTLQARFDQERSLGLLATKVSSRGQLELVLPQQLRWELSPPDAVTYWVGPSGIAYQSSGSQGTRDRDSAGPMGGVLQDLLTAIGGDIARLAPRYDIETIAAGDGGVRVVIRPREEAGARVMRSLDIVLDRELTCPREVRLEESSEDAITVRFRDVRVNQPIDAARMRPPRSAR